LPLGEALGVEVVGLEYRLPLLRAVWYLMENVRSWCDIEITCALGISWSPYLVDSSLIEKAEN
jgi:hypothetical protein